MAPLRSRFFVRIRGRVGLGVGLGVILSLASLVVIAMPGTAVASTSTDSAGCYMAVSPTAGPVGTHATIYGSTVSCGNTGAFGGGLVFQDEHAAVPIPNARTFVPAHGTFSYEFTIPSAMPSGTPAAAAQYYNGGGPVAPGPADFAVFMGAPLPIVTFDVTAAPSGWADYVAITGTSTHCAGCFGTGYDIFRSDGYLATFGGSPNAPGNAGRIALAAPVTGAAFTPDDAGYWLVGADGGVFSFGDAQFYGSMGGQRLNAPVVGIAATPDGKGYWLVGADGGVFSFGDAQFYGSMGGQRLNAPVVGMAATPDGKGYWLVGADGGVFSFGDAQFYGSMGGQRLNAPMVGIAATPDGKGYWLVGADGGVFSFGDAQFYGSMGGKPLNKPVVGMAPTPDGHGYWLLGQDGGVFTFGDAPFDGSGRNATLS
jgi:TM2 domain-containing membrane protein YozV